MILHPAQNKIAEDLHRFRVLVCGRKFGKTSLASEEIKGASISLNDQRVMYMAPTLLDARRLMWDRLKKELSPVIKYENDSRLELKVRTVKGGTSFIFLGSWELVNNYRGDEFNLIVPDEAQDYRNFFVGWQESMRPTLTPRKGSALFMGTPKGYNHLYDLYNKQEEDKDFKSFRFTTYDNPYVPVEEIEKAKVELTEDRFSQEYLADFRKMEGLVYKEFRRETHVYSDDALSKNARITKVLSLVGIDWGYTNPCAIIHCYKDRDAHYWIVSEYYKTQRTDDEITEYAKSLGATYYYPDPAEPDRVDKLRRNHLNVRDVSNDIEAGINAVRALFKANRVHIHSSCINLISELETYHYPEKKSDKNEPELPVDEHNHALSSLRYMLYMQDPVGGERIKAQQFTPTSHIRKGYRSMI